MNQTNMFNRVTGVGPQTADTGYHPQVPATVQGLAGQVERMITMYPVTCLSIALSLGVLVGWWSKRR